MRRTVRALLQSAIVGFLAASAASGQTLDEICPGAEDGTGALWGGVRDSDADMILPGASVIASWEADGKKRDSEVQVGLDGAYQMCYLPLETVISVSASFGTMGGQRLDVTMTEVFTRQDLTLSMSGGGDTDTGDDRLWMCVNGGQSEINMQHSRLIRCDDNWQPLEQCPKVELGLISVQPIGAGSGVLREMLEQLVQEAKRLGANAVVNVQDSRGGLSVASNTDHPTSITAEGVLIEVNPTTC